MVTNRLMVWLRRALKRMGAPEGKPELAFRRQEHLLAAYVRYLGFTRVEEALAGIRKAKASG